MSSFVGAGGKVWTQDNDFLAKILGIKRAGTKLEAARLHFLSDVFLTS